MSISSLASAQQAISSGIDSVVEGISKASQTNGPALIKEAMDAFSAVGTNAFSSSGAAAFQRSVLPSPGHLEAPHKFFSNLSVTNADTAGKFPASELAKKVNDPNLNVHSSLLELAASIKKEEGKLDSMGDMTQLMQMRLQKYLDAYTKMFEMLSNALKKIGTTSDNMVQNLK
jgi:hypothetical protein